MRRGEFLDTCAGVRSLSIDSYRQRARELTELVHDADLSAALAEQYQEELAELAATVASAVGLGGRSRRFPDNDERARTAVRKALMRAVDRVGTTEPGARPAPAIEPRHWHDVLRHANRRLAAERGAEQGPARGMSAGRPFRSGP